jgi:riboflavin transporter FmnP|tara:strand:- start:3533 stop:4138 length:606 start_codon:yes stop_codon:yes gene_type:complete
LSKPLLDRRLLTASILFSSIALVLHPPFLPLAIPAPYAPFLFYTIWEIPLYICLFLFGPTTAIISGIINLISLLVFFPGQLISGPIYNLIAIFGSYAGVVLIKRRKFVQDTDNTKNNILSFNMLIIIASPMIFRTAIMTAVNFIALPMPPPIGFSIPMEVMPTTLGLIAIFNSTTIMYSMPIAYWITKAVKSAINKTWIFE